MNCQWRTLTKGSRCIRPGCWNQLPRDFDTAPHCTCNGKALAGDRTERLLASIGVTPERFQEAKAAVGLAPECSCADVKAWMNKAERWLRDKTSWAVE